MVIKAININPKTVRISSIKPHFARVLILRTVFSGEGVDEDGGGGGNPLAIVSDYQVTIKIYCTFPKKY